MSRRSTGPDKLTVEALWARSRGRCEISGVELSGERSIGWHVHHRKPRKAGGTRWPGINGIENLLLLSPSAHARVESERTEAYANGWLVRQNDDPAAVQVLIRGRQWCLLTDDGQYRVIESVGLPEVIGGQ